MTDLGVYHVNTAAPDYYFLKTGDQENAENILFVISANESLEAYHYQVS